MHPLGYALLTFATTEQWSHVGGFDVDQDCFVAISEVDVTQPRTFDGVYKIGSVIVVGPVVPKCGALCVSPVLEKLMGAPHPGNA